MQKSWRRTRGFTGIADNLRDFSTQAVRQKSTQSIHVRNSIQLFPRKHLLFRASVQDGYSCTNRKLAYSWYLRYLFMSWMKEMFLIDGHAQKARPALNTNSQTEISFSDLVQQTPLYCYCCHILLLTNTTVYMLEPATHSHKHMNTTHSSYSTQYFLITHYTYTTLSQTHTQV